MINTIMIITLIIGIILILNGIRLFAKKRKIRERSTEKTIGKIVNKYVKVKETPRDDGGYSTDETEYIVYQYAVNGVTYTITMSNSLSGNDFTIDQEVEIYYNPQNPFEHYIDNTIMPISITAATNLIIGVGAILALIILSIVNIVAGPIA